MLIFTIMILIFVIIKLLKKTCGKGSHRQHLLLSARPPGGLIQYYLTTLYF